MAQGDRLNPAGAQELKDKILAGKAINGLEVIEAVAVEGPDGLPALQLNSGPSVMPGLSIPPHDYFKNTYVVAGNGIGELETVVYRQGGSGGTIVATVTITYDANDEIDDVTLT